MRRSNNAYDERDVMCLCPNCRDVYRRRGFRVVKAGDVSDTCDICLRLGRDYYVVGLLSGGKLNV